MLSTTRQVIKALEDLPIENFLIVSDEDENEYIIQNISKRKMHGDDDKEWYYALNIKKKKNGCIMK